jgi:hypothetical protein
LLEIKEINIKVKRIGITSKGVEPFTTFNILTAFEVIAIPTGIKKG